MKYLFIILASSFMLMACKSTQQKTTGMTQTTDWQGHRGSRGLMPENTIPAMLKAIDLGVATLELDVVISKDQQVVVSHDVFFHQNITTTPAGKTVSKAEAEKLLLYTMNYDSIRKYDVGLKPHPDFPRQQKMAVVKPLLSDLLKATEAYAKEKGRSVGYNIEIKSKPSNDGVRHPQISAFVDLVIHTIKTSGVAEKTIVQSFDPRGLQLIHSKYPGIATSLLMEGTDKRGLEAQLKELGYTPEAYSPHFSLVNAELVAECHKRKMKVIPWTVNSAEQIRKLVDLGVDGIISDYPDLFAQFNTVK